MRKPYARVPIACAHYALTMATLVTGASGFLGRHLVPLLTGAGEQVRALIRPSADDTGLADGGVEVVRGDPLDPPTVESAARGCRRVFHLVGMVSHERRRLPELELANVRSVEIVLGALEPGARLVHVSSVAALGPAPGPDRPADEQQAFPRAGERFPYAVTKLGGERVALDAARAGADVVVANPGFFLGPGDVHRVSTWPVHRYLQGVLRFSAPGGLAFVDARDVAAGLVALGEKGRTGERYVLTSPEGNLSWDAFFRRIAEVTGVRRRMISLSPRAALIASSAVRWPVSPDEVRAATNWWFATPAKAEAELGFATRPLAETIAATAADRSGPD
jgi:dihydroflavonol-4-reductase